METLSAFLDGEAIDPKDLAEALGAPGAREVLKDFALIRAEVLSDESQPGAAFYQRMNRMLESPVRRKPWWSAAVPVPAYALAATAVFVVAVGVWAGRGITTSSAGSSEIPPKPDRVVTFQPGVDWNQNVSGSSAPMSRGEGDE